MRLLITGIKCSQAEINILKKMGHDVIYREREDAPIDYDCVEIDFVICNWLFTHHDIRKFKSLKYIQLLSAGLDRVPIEYIKENNITLFNARGVYSIPMAEFAVSGILDIYKQKKRFFEQQNHKSWRKIRDLEELSDKSVCIMGTGSVGIEIAKRIKPFVSVVNGLDIICSESDEFDKVYHVSDTKAVLEKSDIIIITMPLTDQTRGMFNKSLFMCLPYGCTIVNVARGGIINEDDLVAELRSGKLMGAVLDVFENEPLNTDSELWEMENVIITPHNSFVSGKNNERLWSVILKNLEGSNCAGFERKD